MDAEAREKLERTTRWEPQEAEPAIFRRWLDGGYFHPEATGTPEENYSIAIPPPNVTGALHMGHALNGSVQDVLVRRARMEGRNTLWILGTDHAGIATQAVVEKRLREDGTDRHELGREAFTERVWAWKEEYGARIRDQYQRLGASCDYDRERFTLDDDYARAVRRVFVELYEKGLIYRDEYMVNWDPGSRSAISDLEVENRDQEDTLFSISYPIEGSDRSLTVATVRPETMMADTAVAVNPTDERYSDLVGGHCTLPLVGRRIPIIADEHVDPGFGTGALKITPGHDANDFEIGRRHGLEEVTIIGEDGRMLEEAGERFAGLTVAEAQEAVVSALKEEGVLEAEEPYVHSVPFSHRSGERIEPLISLQWFCRMEELAGPAIEAVERDEVRITPERWKRVYLDWMREIRPWCISRQLWWGHRIPVWYRGDETWVGEEAPEGEGWVQDEDVLDTWFSSAIWPFATLGWPDDTPDLRAFYPTDFLTTAREILFLWVARMVMTGIEFTGKVPFDDVYVHAVIQARDGRRMSKSLGTGIDPLEEIDRHGADALRFGLLAMSSTQDVRFSDARVEQGRDLANKLWNASRLILLNVEAPDPAGRIVPPLPEADEDRWILSRLESTIATFGELVSEYDFSHAVGELYDFVFTDLCDWYLEIVKPRIYDGDPSLAPILLSTLERTLALVHAVMPFVTEEIWGYHPYREGELVVHELPVADPTRIDLELERAFGEAIGMTRLLRSWRDAAGVPAGTVLRVVEPEEAGTWEFVTRLGRAEAVQPDGDEPLATVAGFGILPGEGLDPAGIAERLDSRRSKLEAELEKVVGRLDSPGFTEKAPPEVVSEERRREQDLPGQDRRTRLTEAAPERSTGEWFDSLAEVGWRPGLERMGPLMELLGSPQDRYRTVHVVGTNGKTSTTLYGAALLGAAGMSAGSHTSPHLTDWTERIRVSGEPIGAAAWGAALEKVRPVVDQVEARMPDHGSLSQFEVATAAGFVALADAGVEAAMIEAGMGGRLDSTNVISSETTVLTSIGLDHTEWLGETELEIAGEKLAVLRPDTRLVVGPLREEVRDLAVRTAADRGCELVEVGDPGPGPAAPEGQYARIDFALALAATEPLTGPMDEASRRLALDRAGVRGRLEVTGSDPPVVFDVAHNRDGIRAVVEALGEVIGDRQLAVVFGCLSDRDPVQLLEPLVTRTAALFACQAPDLVGSRARTGLPAEAIAAAARELGMEAEPLPEPVDALAAAVSAAAAFDGAVLVCGSHGLVASLSALQP